MAIAFFDMDKTLLRIDSGTSWMRFLYGRGEISKLRLARTVLWGFKYKLAVLDIERLASRLALLSEGEMVADIDEKARVWYEVYVQSQVTKLAQDRLGYHKERGDTVALLTASTQFAAEPVAKDNAIEHVLCSRLGVRNGQLTGKFDSFCHGEGKVPLAEGFAEEQKQSLDDAWFYSDSYNDLPMLERVGNPVVVNPDPRLLRVAKRRRWQICHWQ